MSENSLKSLADFYYFQLNNNPKKDAFSQKENGKWVSLSSQEFVEKSIRLSKGLLKLGVKHGDRIAVIANNRIEWHLTDLAIQQIGAINVPIYSNINAEDYLYILNDCGAKFVFLSDPEVFDKIQSVRNQIKSLESIFTYENISGCTHYKELLTDEYDGNIDNLKNNIQYTDTATLIYTSGTTGNPKGVMLTHENLITNVIASSHRLPLGDNLKSLSFLPLCHVFKLKFKRGSTSFLCNRSKIIRKSVR